MTISHIHCRVKDLAGAVSWFDAVCAVASSFSNGRIAVLEFGTFTLILAAAPDDSAVTLGFHSDNCDADFSRLVERGGEALDAPSDRSYGVRAAYLQGPGAITIELEQMLKPDANATACLRPPLGHAANEPVR
jgi:hypothetical protein